LGEKRKWRKGGFKAAKRKRGEKGRLASWVLGKSEAMDGVGCSESIIDIHNADSRGAGVEHTEKSGESLKVKPIADGSGDSDERVA
jgi:hypothetical protein